ncbi:3'-to-5' oligoribonuclease (orn) [Caballeronia sordidicola]|nr:3'-to-5' oligoribonuclease (orn) [Caballeronia sordidicola]
MPTSATTNTTENARLKLDISGNPIKLCENYRFLAVTARMACCASAERPGPANHLRAVPGVKPIQVALLWPIPCSIPLLPLARQTSFAAT